MFEYEVKSERNGLKLYNLDKKNNDLISSTIYNRTKVLESFFLNNSKKELSYELAKSIIDDSRSVISIMLGQDDEGKLLNLWDSQGYVCPDNGCDNDINSHSANVSIAAMRAAIKSGIKDDRLLGICAGSILHDLGEYFSLDLVNSGRRLTDREYQRIKQHPKQGYDSAKKAVMALSKQGEISQSARDDVLNIILYHQQKFDGSGYPYGIEGREIPYAAQFVQPLDAIDSMTSIKKYNRTMTKGESLDELLSNAYTQFNPDVVELISRQYCDYTMPFMRVKFCGKENHYEEDRLCEEMQELESFLGFNSKSETLQRMQAAEKSGIAAIFPSLDISKMNLGRGLEMMLNTEKTGDTVN